MFLCVKRGEENEKLLTNDDILMMRFHFFLERNYYEIRTFFCSLII